MSGTSDHPVGDVEVDVVVAGVEIVCFVLHSDFVYYVIPRRAKLFLDIPISWI